MVEKENFHRFCGLLLDIGAKVLREVFLDKYVRTSTLAGYLARHKQHLTGLLPNTLRKEQFDLLYPPGGGVPVIEDLDITLLCLLFRNLDTQITPYDSVWTDPQTHQTYQADVTRIRLARNMLFGHVNSASMCRKTYDNEVRNLTTIYNRLVQSLSAGRMSSTELQEMIYRELNGPLQISLDTEVKSLEKKMQEWCKHDEEFEKAIEANREKTQKGIKEVSETQEDMKREIQSLQERIRQLETSRQWDCLSRGNVNVEVDICKMKKRIAFSKEVLDGHRDHAAKFFVENERYRKGKEILAQHGKIFITGIPGQGKTYLAYQLLLEILKEKKDLNPLIISSPDEWIQLADPSTELGIVVDDMCGRHGLQQGELKNWNKNARFITALIDKRKHAVIFTMRTHIHAESAGQLQLVSDISDPLCLTNITLNLDNDSMTLRGTDKIEFATKYLHKFGLTKDDVLKLCRISQASIGFPLLCGEAQRIEDKSKLLNWFTRPLELMLKELKCLSTDKYVSYGTLVLAMLAGGTLTSESIDEYSATSDRKKEVKLIFDSCGVPDVKLVEIQHAANALCGTYLLFNESDESYSFVHDTTEEAVFLSYAKLHKEQTLKLCSLRSVCKLCRINNQSQGSNVQASAFMLVLQPHYYDILIERFIKALETKNPRDYANLAEASVWSSDQFRKLFMDTCKTIHSLADKDQNSLLVHAANANNSDLASELLGGMKQIRADNLQQAVSYLTKAAKASCVHKDLGLFKQFMKTGNVNGNDILSATVETGSEEAMIFLLQNGANINYRSENGESLLHTACLHGKLDMVKVLHSKYSLSVNQCDRKGRSVCHSAASGGNVDILNFLVREDADPLRKDIDGMNLLHYACLEGKKDMAFHLMNNYPNMLCNVGKRGFTVLHCAAYGGSIDILNMVCKLMNEPSQTVYNSSLNVSSRANSGYLKDIFNKFCQLLNLRSPTDSNKHSDSNSLSKEKESHHEIQADLKTRTKTEETLLHMACLSGKLEMTKHLVQTYPDMINEVDDRKGTPGHYAAESSNVFVLQYLIDQGLDPWCTTAAQETLLHKSCLAGQLEMTKYLVKKYPDMIHKVDNCNETQAHYAAQSSNVSVLQYLIDQGLDPWCRTSTQQTLLHKSCIRGQLEMTQYLLEKYPDMIKAVDKCKETPDQYAAQSSNVSVLQYLIGQGLDPWHRTATHETFLHKSCFAGQLEMTQYLLEQYPDMINAVDNCKGTPAHYAAESSNVSLLQYLIDQGFDPWCRTATQETLLHRSCFAGQLEMSKYLVDKYHDMINEVDDSKETPAHYAAQCNNISVIQYLISQGQDPWCISARHETLLHKSCIRGQLEMTQYLLKQYPDMINAVDNCKGTPAHHAAESGNVSVLEYLVDQGLDPWCRTATQETLIHRSCFAGQLEMSKYLVEKYTDMINKVDDSKRTPAHHAAESGNVSVLKYLIDQGLDPWYITVTQETILHRACFAGQLEMSKFLVETYPGMIHMLDEYKRTPAHAAAQSGNVHLLQYLIDQGLDPYCRTSKKQTLLHISCIKGQLEITQYLVENYPDMMNQGDNLENTPAQCASLAGNVSVVRYLIDQGLDPWCRTPTQLSLLHLSCITGQLEMIQYLVEEYPDMIHELDNCKRTPADHAVQKGYIYVLKYLINQGLDPWCRTDTQETLLHRSCLAGQFEMSKYLVEKYPDMIHEVENRRRTPAHHAAESGNIYVLKYLINQGLDPWCRTDTQETLLHRSCLAGQLEMSKYLVEKYPHMIQEVEKCRRTPAHHAAESGNVSVLKYLIDQGLGPWYVTLKQETLLHRACFAGQLEMSKFLVETYPGMIHMLDNYKRTPAHHAAESGNISVLKYLIDQGLDPWYIEVKQETLLHRACFAGQLEMSKFLVETYPGMIHMPDDYKRTPAHAAAQSGNVHLLQYLIDQGLDPNCRTFTKQTLLHISCIKGQLEITQHLVEKYPDMINQVDNLENTPVQYAALGGKVSVLQYLIGQGLDPWCRTPSQHTLLHLSCITGQLEMIQYLVEQYPDMINKVSIFKETPAHCATTSRNVSILEYLIGQGLDPWCRTSTEVTLLYMACLMGQLEMAKYLVETYPDMIEEVDIYKGTPAHSAAFSGNVSLLQYLINRGINPLYKTYTQETLLHKSCIKGRLEMTQYLVKKYPDMVEEVDNRKRTPAHHAAQSGNVSVLKYLIDKGLDPLCKTSTQQTLLHSSCAAVKLEIGKFLVETYPDMIHDVANCTKTSHFHVVNSDNVSVLKYILNPDQGSKRRTSKQDSLIKIVRSKGKLEMIQYLVAKYPDMIHEVDNYKRTPACFAAESGDVSVLKYLIDQGLNPLCRTSTEQTLLHISSMNGQLEITQHLVEEYPDMINQVDMMGNTPVQSAALGGNVAVLQYLIGEGLDPWCITPKQQTLIHLSSSASQLEMINYLVEQYPDMINKVGILNETPAHCAAASNNVSVVEYLIGQGLDPYCRTSTKQTLLHISCRNGQLEITQYLVEKYPDMINQVDMMGNTPVQCAALGGKVSVLQYLIGQGLDPWCRNPSQHTLLHMACSRGQLEMASYLVETYPDMIKEVDILKGTPAHCAALSGNVSLLEYLINQGIDPLCKTVTQETLLHISCMNGRLEMTQYLVKKYPNMVKALDNHIRTPADYAAKSSNPSLLLYLTDQGLYP